MRIVCMFIVLLSSLLVADNSWGGNTGYQFLEVPVGLAAIGRGYTGAAYGSKFARFYNPALYGSDSSSYMAIEFGGNGFRDTKEFAGEIYVPVKDYFFALELLNRQIDGIGITGDFPGLPVDEGEWQSSEFSLTAGVRRTEWFTWALSLGGAFERFGGDITKAFLFNVGATAEILDDKLVAGLSVLNLGRTSSFLNEGKDKLGTGENLPTSARFGFSYKQPVKNVSFVLNADVKYMHYYDSTEKVLDNFKDRIYVPLGLEVHPVEWFVVRMGKQINHSTDKFNFGGGVKTDLFDADFSFIIRDFDGQIEPYWKAGVTFNMGNLFGSDTDSAKADTVKPVEIKEPLVIVGDTSEVTEDEVTKDEVTEDEVTEDEVTEDEVTEDEVTEDEVAEDEVTEDEVTEDEVTEDEVTEDEVTEDEVTEDEVTEDEVTEDEVTEDEVTEDEVTEDEVTEDEVTEDEVLEEEFIESN